MPLGGVSATLVTGGAQASASGADLVRTIVSLGVSPLAPSNTLLHPSSSGSARDALDRGQLAEAQALLWQVSGAGGLAYALAAAWSIAGGVGAVTDSSNATATLTPSAAPFKSILVYCTLGGVIGTMKVKISFDGGLTFGAIVTSVDSGAGSWVYPVPGTFTTLTFAAATYVATKTCTIDTTGTVTNGAAWVGVVTQVSSPVDSYDVKAICQIAGALGVAAYAVSLDGGRTQFGPAYLTPSGGVVVIPGTGVVLTFSGTSTAGETHSFPCVTVAPSTQAISDAITAALADPTAPASAVLDLCSLPSSRTSAFTLAASLESALETAFVAGKDWLAIMTCPLVGDNVSPSGTAIVDTADTRTAVKTARVGVNAPRVSVFCGTDYVQSAIGTYQVRRPRSTSFAMRIAGTLPVEANGNSVAARALGPLQAVAKIGDDEMYPSSAISLYDAQLNSFQSVPQQNGAFLTIGRGYYGWQSLTTDANEIDADGFRAINAVLAGFRPTCAQLVGRRYQLNVDGTVADKVVDSIDVMLQSAIEKRAGIGAGADFGGVPQLIPDNLTARWVRSTNLGPTGDKVIRVRVTGQPFGFASAVDIVLYFQGA